MSRIICRIARSAPDGSFLSGRFDRHRSACLRCQADVIRQRTVSRDLGDLEGETMEAPGGLHTRVMATLPTQDAADPRRELVLRVVARYVAAIGVAVAALAAILGNRARRNRA